MFEICSNIISQTSPQLKVNAQATIGLAYIPVKLIPICFAKVNPLGKGIKLQPTQNCDEARDGSQC
jgi:hypothetical protein